MEFPVKWVLDALYQWGAPGVIIFVLGWWIWRLEKDKAALILKMLAAYEKGAITAEANTKATTEWLIANEARTRALDVTVDAIRVVGLNQVNMTEKLTGISTDLKELVGSHNRLREALIEFRGRFGRDQ